jgi:hypothetical protein
MNGWLQARIYIYIPSAIYASLYKEGRLQQQLL